MLIVNYYRLIVADQEPPQQPTPPADTEPDTDAKDQQSTASTAGNLSTPTPDELGYSDHPDAVNILIGHHDPTLAELNDTPSVVTEAAAVSASSTTNPQDSEETVSASESPAYSPPSPPETWNYAHDTGNGYLYQNQEEHPEYPFEQYDTPYESDELPDLPEPQI